MERSSYNEKVWQTHKALLDIHCKGNILNLVLPMRADATFCPRHKNMSRDFYMHVLIGEPFK